MKLSQKDLARRLKTSQFPSKAASPVEPPKEPHSGADSFSRLPAETACAYCLRTAAIRQPRNESCQLSCCNPKMVRTASRALRWRLVYPTPSSRWKWWHARSPRKAEAGHRATSTCSALSTTRRLLFNRHMPIPDQVSFRCDFPRWLETLAPRERRIADLLALGHSTKATAKRFGLSEGRISQLRRQMHESWQGFHGEVTVPMDARPSATT